MRLLAAPRQLLTVAGVSIVALIGRRRPLTYHSNYCAVDPGNSDVPRNGLELGKADKTTVCFKLPRLMPRHLLSSR